MTKSHWAAVEVALRSYMADVTGRQHWSPIHDHLHYALITGDDGERRWHLIHPDAMPALHGLGLPFTLHDQLGGEIRSGSELSTIRGSFHANRVSSVIGDHPEYGPVVVKGHEAHANTSNIVIPSTAKSREVLPTQRMSAPPRSLRWSEKPDPRAPDGKAGFGELLNLHSDLLPYEQRIRSQLDMDSLSRQTGYRQRDGQIVKTQVYLRPQALSRPNGTTPAPVTQQLQSAIRNGIYNRVTKDFGPTAEWFTQAARTAGAPVVPVWQGVIGDKKDDANNESPEHPAWYLSENQYASFQPYVADAAEAAAVLGVTHLRARELKPEHRAWIERLEGRLTSAEQIAGAPDCHGGNYIDVPCLMPDGNVMTVKHGIDYEWQPSHGGLLMDSTQEATEHAQVAGEYAAPDVSDLLGNVDTLGTLQHWPNPHDYGLSHGEGPLDDVRQSWQSEGALSSDPYYAHLDKVMRAARQKHQELGGRDINQAEHPL